MDRIKKMCYRLLLTWRLNSQLRHAGLDPASSVFLDSRLRGNDELRVFNRRSNNRNKSTKSRLTEKQIAVFQGSTLFDKIGKSYFTTTASSINTSYLYPKPKSLPAARTPSRVTMVPFSTIAEEVTTRSCVFVAGSPVPS